MVTMKWMADGQGQLVPAWKVQEPATAQTKQFGPHSHKAIRPSLQVRAAARRRLLKEQAAH